MANDPMANDPMANDIDETVAYIALRRVQNRYADIVTRQAWAELQDIMSPTCLITVNTVDRSFTFDGPDAIGEFIRTQIHDRFSFFEFVVLNTVMEIDTERGLAAARMYMQEVRQESSDGTRSDAYGVYHDRFVRDADGKWWMDQRFYRSFARTNPDDGPDLVVFDPPDTNLVELMNLNL